MTDTYILDANDEPQPIDDLIQWAEWYETSRIQRRLAFDDLGEAGQVSTVFLGQDHSFGGPSPILWETMVFGGPLDQEQERYNSREEALQGHQKMVARCRTS